MNNGSNEEHTPPALQDLELLKELPTNVQIGKPYDEDDKDVVNTDPAEDVSELGRS